MKKNLIHRAFGAIVFIISAVQIISTAQVSVSFWDPGELSAAAYSLQVPHPPGGPLFSLMGRVMYMLPLPGDFGFRMNMVSALASVCTVLLLYLIAVRVIEHYRGKNPDNSFDSILTYCTAAIGALTLSFSDTFWFNASESNYFASSTLLYSLMVWLMLIWNEKADERGSERYLILIAFLAGLSASLHLMSILTVVAVAVAIALRKYIQNEKECLQSAYIFVGHIALLILIACIMWSAQKTTQPPSSAETHTFDVNFVVAMGIASAVVFIIFRKKIFNRNSYYAGYLFGGIALAIIFPGVIRLMPAFLLSVAGDNLETGFIVLLGLMVLIGLGAYWAQKNKYMILSLSFAAILAVMLGFTTYTMIVIRANDTLPMNENHPSSFAQLVSYLNREQYGDFPIFKRRWSPEPEKAGIYSNYSSDLDFFWRYQMDHMFQRYVFWNFIGYQSHDQDAGVSWKGFFGIPLFLGLWGLYYHFKKDWKMASVFLFLFVLMGYLITFYQNQQQPQPRDREYFYCGAYLVFVLWITLGIRGILDIVQEKMQKPSYLKPAMGGVLLVCTLFVPLRMFQVNYYNHDRSKNWVPWDFAYNLLQSCEKDAILFTQGDNDTFPLWYIQDVAGVRRDVRIVNLSLVNTSWYIQEMKDKAAYPEAKPVRFTMSNAQIAELQPIAWNPRNVLIPISKETIKEYQEREGVTLDTSITNHGAVTFFLKNTLQFGQTKALRVQDIAVYDIIVGNEWKRPIYFSTTCSPDAKIGLDEFLWFKGLVWKLEPRKTNSENNGIDKNTLEANLLHEVSGFSRTLQTGFKFRELANPNVYFDENTLRIISNYRNAFRVLAMYYDNFEKNSQKALAVLDKMDELMPHKKIPLGWEFASDLMHFYNAAGQTDKVNEFGNEVENECLSLIQTGNINVNSYYNPYRVLLDLYEMKKDNQKLLGILQKLTVLYPTNAALKQKIAMTEMFIKQEQMASTSKDSLKNR